MLTFEHTVPTLLIWLIAGVAFALVTFSFHRSLPVSPSNIALFVLRTLFMAMLFWCLFQPQRRHSITTRVRPHFLVAVDSSQSMSLSARPGVTDRWTVARQVLNGNWRTVLGEKCRMDAFRFSTRLGPRIELDETLSGEPNAPATALRSSMAELAERYRGQDVVGLLLLSDGLDTGEPSDDWAKTPWDWPVYTLCHEPPPPAEAAVEPDLRVDSVKTSKRVTVGWTTELKAMVSGRDTGGNPANVQLFKNDELVGESAAWIPDKGGSKEITFNLDHPETGVFVYRVVVPAFPKESRTNDNACAVPVQVVDTKNRLLYVEGPPRWESKFLLRTLKASSRITPLCFIRGSDGAFMALGPRGDLTPDITPEQLALVKMVVLGNLSGDELGAERARNIVDFVESGGSLVLLGGAKGWAEAGFPATPLKKLLPVASPIRSPVEGTFAAGLTESGRAHAAFAGDPALWENVPPVLSVFPSGPLSPGADALVTAETPDGPVTVVAVQRYGQGKVVALLTDSLWRWKLNPDENDRRPYERFWDQLIAWLSPSEMELSPETVDIFADVDQLHLGEEIAISARIGKSGQDTVDPVLLRCEITTPDDRRIPFTMAAQHVITPTGKVFPGFSVRFTAEQPGLHTAVAIADRRGKTVKSDPLSFFVTAFTAERVPCPANVGVLRSLAERSGGRFFQNPARLDQALADLKVRTKDETRTTHSSLWQTTVFISCLLTLLTAEWVIRKWRNMA